MSLALPVLDEGPARFVRLCLAHQVPLSEDLLCPITKSHPTTKERLAGYTRGTQAPWWVLWDRHLRRLAAIVKDMHVQWAPGYEDLIQPSGARGRDRDGFSGRNHSRRTEAA